MSRNKTTKNSNKIEGGGKDCDVDIKVRWKYQNEKKNNDGGY